MASLILFLTLVIHLEIVLVVDVIKGEPLVPALFAFGDSIVDVGNNNYLATVAKANFFPYGRDFVSHSPTGRFSNGKVVSDYTSELFGFPSYQPAYLSLTTKGNNLLNGVNFGSAGSGYYEFTAKKYQVLTLSQQLNYYKDYQKELVKIAGQSTALSIIYGSIYFVISGSADFALNYYTSPVLQTIYTPYQFSDILLQNYFNFIQDLYALGARKIAVSTLPPIEKLLQKFPKLRLIILDTYQSLYKLITKPSDYGFFESRRACCGTGLLEVAIFCNRISVGTCTNASEYVFWDSFHPTEATNKYLIDYLAPTLISFIQT
ncbi:unnamed protein product [Vicia faba]|uniref:GDSL esterase/lipase n=1 Tax=Vicia faba TaxID=3906 RepID=A0AAV0ZJT1_VICFA|nr:unnamed protein product [Vicia faba]